MRQNKSGTSMQSDRLKGKLKVLGITGGVGAGKSTILSYLRERHGARILEADEIGHQVQEPGEACWKRIVDTFGREILNKDDTIDRGRLATLVYADRGKMEQLNAIVHPAVKARILEEIDSFQPRLSPEYSLIVVEAALLLEDHYDAFCDEVWYIYADEQTRIRRLALTRGYSPEKSRQIMKNQLSEEAFRRQCKVVIDNSSDDVTCAYAQIEKALGERKFYN